MKRPRNLARMSDGARLGWAVVEALYAEFEAEPIGPTVGAAMHLSQHAHDMALGWPDYIQSAVTCPERRDHRTWKGIPLVIEPAFADDQFEIRKGQAA